MSATFNPLRRIIRNQLQVTTHEGLLDCQECPTLYNMETVPNSQRFPAMKLLRAYTGITAFDEVLENPRALRLLWLEILINEHVDLSPWETHPEVKKAYQKACAWFTTYRQLIESIIPRSPLPTNHKPIDFRDYRTFAEALRFATTLA